MGFQRDSIPLAGYGAAPHYNHREAIPFSTACRAFFKKRAGSRVSLLANSCEASGAPCRDPQIAKLSKRIKSSGAWCAFGQRADLIEAPIPK